MKFRCVPFFLVSIHFYSLLCRYFFLLLGALIALGLFHSLVVLPMLLSLMGPPAELIPFGYADGSEKVGGDHNYYYSYHSYSLSSSFDKSSAKFPRPTPAQGKTTSKKANYYSSPFVLPSLSVQNRNESQIEDGDYYYVQRQGFNSVSAPSSPPISRQEVNNQHAACDVRGGNNNNSSNRKKKKTTTTIPNHYPKASSSHLRSGSVPRRHNSDVSLSTIAEESHSYLTSSQNSNSSSSTSSSSSSASSYSGGGGTYCNPYPSVFPPANSLSGGGGGGPSVFVEPEVTVETTTTTTYPPATSGGLQQQQQHQEQVKWTVVLDGQ